MSLTKQEFDESLDKVQEFGFELESFILLFKDFCEKNCHENEKILSLLRLAEVISNKCQDLNDCISDMEKISIKLS